MTVTLHPRLQALESLFATSTLTQLIDDDFSAQQIEVWIKRDDLLHPIISGNKWRKLKYSLNHALNNGADTLVSMGGAYSNHLHALAYVGQKLAIKTAAFIRGERPDNLNPTLWDLEKWGMELRFVSRSDYRLLRAYKYHDSLPDSQPGQYWLPEGGAGDLALLGVSEILHEIDQTFDIMVTACGTGTTLAGLIAAAPKHTTVLGIAALKGVDFLNQEVQQFISTSRTQAEWKILQDYHFGGFAKTKPELSQFIAAFQAKHSVPLEPVYTAKMMFAVYDLLQQGYFKPGQRILVLHTGGLQGNRGKLPYRDTAV